MKAKQTRVQELLETPRMYYYDHLPQNSVKGLYDLINEYVNPKTVMVEIGSFSGVSSELFALHCHTIHCVDLWQPYSEIVDSNMSEGEVRFDNMIKGYKNIVKIKQSSTDASKTFENGSLDLVYIDAAHDYQNVKNDILQWLPKVASKGFIAGHDYTIPGVSQAVNEVLGECKVFDDTSWIIQVK